MSATPGDPPSSPQGQSRDWTKNLIIPVLVAVVGGLLLVVFTPAGTGARELFFPTKASVTGMVELDGAPVPRAALTLDGVPSKSTTDDAGRFQLTDVGDGRHTVRIVANGARPRDYEFNVQTGAASADLGVIKVDAYLRLGYFASVQGPTRPSGNPKVKYDVTLWLLGDDGAMREVQRVAYILPAPLPADQVAGADLSRAFCYRVQGSIPFDDLMVLGGAFATATANIELSGGRAFTVAAAPSSQQPAKCKAHKGSELKEEVERVPFPGGNTGGNPGGNPNTNPGTPKVTIPAVAGLTETAAMTRLVELLLQPRSEPQPSASVAKGTVIGTAPEAGARVDQGGRVTVLVSSGPEEEQPVEVPNVVALRLDEAREILERLKFGVSVVTSEAPSNKPRFTVLSQKPEGGSKIKRGSEITLTLAAGG
ncbi:MAG TPA: PASTA domain-containing protein [Catenuloplanes sp.]|jgi:hypothetical protein